MSKIVGLKLSNGVEVIGRSEEDPHVGPIKLTEVRIVHAQFTPQGVQLAMPMPPWTVMRLDTPIEFRRDHVTTIIDPVDPEIERAYIQTTSKLDLSGLN